MVKRLVIRCDKHFNAGNFKQCWKTATQWTMHGPGKAYYCDNCARVVATWGCTLHSIDCPKVAELKP